MSRKQESLIETWTAPNLTVLTQPITAVAGNSTIAGTNFNVELATIPTSGFAISFLDDAGKWQEYIIKSKDSDIQITIYGTIRTAATAVTAYRTLLSYSPWLYQPDGALSTIRPDRLLMYGSAANNCYAAVNRQAGGTLDLFRLFSKDESIALKTIYVTLPYQYTLAGMQLGVSLWYSNTAGIRTPITTLGKTGLLTIPIENQEITINAQIPVDPRDAAWGLAMGIVNIPFYPGNAEITLDAVDDFGGEFPCVSAVNAPAALNGFMMPIKLGARVIHTTDLQLATTNDN